MNDAIMPKMYKLIPKIDQMSQHVEPKAKDSCSNVAKKLSTVIIKPKLKQSLEVTKSDMVKTVNPIDTNLSFTKIKETRDGGLLVLCENIDDYSKFKQLITDKLSYNYTVKDIPVLNPRFKVVGISKYVNDEILVRYITTKNKSLICDSSVVIVYIVFAIE